MLWAGMDTRFNTPIVAGWALATALSFLPAPGIGEAPAERFKFHTARGVLRSDRGIDESADRSVKAVTPSVHPSTGVRWYRDLVYCDGAELDPARHVLDLYLPSEKNWMEGRPLLIWLHGGGWVMGSKDDMLGAYGRYCRRLAERGIAAANVSYRLSPQVTHPEHVEDVARAVAWLVERAGRFGFDAQHIFISGHSAGGHLAALVATDDRYLRTAGLSGDEIIGVLPSSGVFDLRDLFDGPVRYGRAFHRASAPAASPLLHIDGHEPPFLLFTESFGAFLRGQTAAMAQRLADAGVGTRVVELEDTNHITMLFDLLRDDGVHVTYTTAFVERCLRETADAAGRR